MVVSRNISADGADSNFIFSESFQTVNAESNFSFVSVDSMVNERFFGLWSKLIDYKNFCNFNLILPAVKNYHTKNLLSSLRLLLEVPFSKL